MAVAAAAVAEQDQRGAGCGVLGGPQGGGHVTEHELAGGDAVGRLVRDETQVCGVQRVHGRASHRWVALPAALRPRAP